MIDNSFWSDVPKCQMQSILQSSDELSLRDETHLPITKSIKLAVKRLIGPYQARAIKRMGLRFFALVTAKKENSEAAKPAINARPLNLQSSDWVHVKSEEEIKATLDEWNELRGCAYLPEMSRYCNTIQMVRRPIMRFVDERDYKVKKASGVVLLEGINCQGTEFYGRCDRSCFFFWREEWLEKEENSIEMSKNQ